MNDEHTLISSLGSEVSPSQAMLPGFPPACSASQTPTPPESSSDTGPPSQSSQTSESLTAASGAEQIYLQADGLASHGAKPGSKEAMQMTVRSGKKCSALLMKPDPVGCLVKMLLESSTWHSTKCFLTWKASGTPQGRLLFRLQASMPIIDGIESSSLLPTPSGVNGGTNHTAGRLDEWGGNHNPFRGTSLGKKRCAIYEEWMMGLPIRHTELTPSEMRSSRRSLSKS